MNRLPARWSAGAAAVLLILAHAAHAQNADEHAGHHPGGKSAPSVPLPAPPAGAGNAMGTGDAMGGMGMGEHGGAARKELYPSLIGLPAELTAERRAEVQRLLHERIGTGRTMIAEAHRALENAWSHGDEQAIQAALVRLREGTSLLESGLSARAALDAGAAPPGIALDWFRREMALSAPEISTGLSLFHYISMATILAFAIMLATMHVARRRRGEALVAKLVARPVAANAAPRAPTAAGGWAGQLRVARVYDEVAGVKTFRLAPLSGEELPFTFEPGQFLTIAATVGGKLLKRSYSIASSPCCHGWCEVTVKKVAGGVSEYLHDQVRAGQVLDASGPYGRFTFRGREAPSVVMVAGGVGITPMMSSIRYLIDQSWDGDIFLVYAAARRDSIIFREELERLGSRHPNLHVTLVLSDEPSPDWKGPRGFVTAELLHANVPDLVSRRVHLCGPPPMMEAVKRELRKLGFPEAQLRTELFLAAEGPVPRPATSSPAKATCHFARSRKEAPLAPGATVLDAAEAAGVDIDYSCRQGYCGLCKVKLLQGEVRMEVEDGLASSDKQAGYVLACQARAERDVTIDA